MTRQSLWLGVMALAGVLLGGSMLLGKPGVVTMPGNPPAVFIGDVDEVSQPGKVVVTDQAGKKLIFNRAGVQSLKYFATPQEEFDARLGALPAQDTRGRLALVKWAFDLKQYDLAEKALDTVRTADPRTYDIWKKAIDAAKPPPVVATRPVVVAPQTRPATPDPVPPVGARSKLPIRQVTAEEISHIRRLELRTGDRVTARVPPDVRASFLASNAIDPAQARNLNAQDLAAAIMKFGTPAMREQVVIATDPSALMEYKQKTNKVITTSCATAACHATAGSGGNLLLFTGDTEPAVYSNFVILSGFTRKHDDVEYLMIDRTRPEESLLANYVLPPDLTKMPHPEVKGYRGAVRNMSDPRYQEILRWQGQTLLPVAPSHGIDLTTEPPPPK